MAQPTGLSQFQPVLRKERTLISIINRQILALSYKSLIKALDTKDCDVDEKCTLTDTKLDKRMEGNQEVSRGFKPGIEICNEMTSHVTEDPKPSHCRPLYTPSFAPTEYRQQAARTTDSILGIFINK